MPCEFVQRQDHYTSSRRRFRRKGDHGSAWYKGGADRTVYSSSWYVCASGGRLSNSTREIHGRTSHGEHEKQLLAIWHRRRRLDEERVNGVALTFLLLQILAKRRERLVYARMPIRQRNSFPGCPPPKKMLRLLCCPRSNAVETTRPHTFTNRLVLYYDALI